MLVLDQLNGHSTLATILPRMRVVQFNNPLERAVDERLDRVELLVLPLRMRRGATKKLLSGVARATKVS